LLLLRQYGLRVLKRAEGRVLALAGRSRMDGLADLIGPDNKRLVEIFNSLPEVKPVTKFANRKIATEHIWKPSRTSEKLGPLRPRSNRPMPRNRPKSQRLSPSPNR
jgi:hypothetical protein